MGLSRKAGRARRNAGRGTNALKMSEVLADVALPLLHELRDEDEQDLEMTYNLASALWNLSRVDDEELRTKALIDLTEIAENAGEAAELQSLFRRVIDRAELLYPGVKRLIKRVEIVPLPGERYTVRVVSSG